MRSWGEASRNGHIFPMLRTGCGKALYGFLPLLPSQFSLVPRLHPWAPCWVGLAWDTYKAKRQFYCCTGVTLCFPRGCVRQNPPGKCLLNLSVVHKPRGNCGEMQDRIPQIQGDSAHRQWPHCKGQLHLESWGPRDPSKRHWSPVPHPVRGDQPPQPHPLLPMVVTVDTEKKKEPMNSQRPMLVVLSRTMSPFWYAWMMPWGRGCSDH